MGLESFKTDSGSNSNSSSSSTSSNSSSSSSNASFATGSVDEADDGDAAFLQSFSNGVEEISDGHKSTVIKEESSWDDIVELIEDKLGLDEEQFMEVEEDLQFEIVRCAKIHLDTDFETEFVVHKTCIVCGNEFHYPDSWDFIRFKSEAVCESHTMEEIKESWDELERERIWL